MWTISKSFMVSYAHRVFNQDLYDTGLTPKCRNLHGHDSEITYEITADSLVNDMVLDYTLLKDKVFHDYGVVHANDLDHVTILSTLDPEFETLSQAIFDKTTLKNIKQDIKELSHSSEFKSITYSGMMIINFVPTAETLSKYLCEQFENFLQNAPFSSKHIIEIAVYFNETKGSTCRYKVPYFKNQKF